MIPLVYTRIGEFLISFYYEEVDQVIEISKNTVIEKKVLENIRLPHIAYKDKWYPLFDLQKIFGVPSQGVKHIIIIKSNQNTLLCGVCTPSPVEEASVERENILVFPPFLLSHQKISLLYASAKIQSEQSFLCSFCDIFHPLTIAQFLLNSTSGGKS